MDYIFESVAPDLSVVPSYATVAEHAIYASISIEETYNSIIESLGVGNSRYGSIYEASDVKETLSKLWEGLKRLVKELWAKFTGFVVNCRNKIAAFVAEKVSNMKKFNTVLHGENVKKAILESDDSKWTKFTDEGGRVPEVDLGRVNKIAQCMVEYSNGMSELIKDIKAHPDDYDLNGSKKEWETTANEELYDAFGGDSTFGNMESFKDPERLRKAIYKAITIQGDRFGSIAMAKKTIAANFDKYVKDVQTGVKGFDKNISTTYKNCKSTLDSAVKEGKAASKAKEMKPLFKMCKEGTRIASIIVSCVESAQLKFLVYEAQLVFKGYAIAAKYKEKSEKKKEEAKNESFDYGYELSSLFDF